MGRGAKIGIMLLVVFILAGGGIKFLRIDADAPQVFPNGFGSDATVKDEAAKSYEARNRTLFDAWSLSEKDDYRYWRTVSPVWSYMVWLWLEAFGVSYFSLRVFSIVWSAVSGLLVFLLLRRSHGEPAGLAAAFFFSFNFYLLIYGRLGLMETALNGVLILTALIIVRSMDRPGLFFIAPLAFLASCLIKQTAFYFAPLVVFGFILAFRGRLSGGGWKSLAFILGLVSIAVAAVVLVYLYSLPEYKLRSVLNLRHALDYGQYRYGMIIRTHITRKALLFSVSPEGVLKGYIMMMPVAGALAALEIITFIYLALSGRRKTGGFRIDRTEAIIIFWFILARATLAFTPHLFVRFYLIQFPPACLLAGIFMKRILEPESERARQRHSYTERLSAYAAILALALALNIVPYVRWLSTASCDIGEGVAEMRRAIGELPAVIIGEWAAPLCLETPYKSYYVKNIFNRRPDQLASFGVTHILFEDPGVDTAAISYREAFPGSFEARREISTIELFGRTLHLCEVRGPALRVRHGGGSGP